VFGALDAEWRRRGSAAAMHETTAICFGDNMSTWPGADPGQRNLAKTSCFGKNVLHPTL
jgi:hypothetical protein